MLIPITFNPKSSQTSTSKLPSALAKISNDEVVLIELQGTLEVDVAQPTDKNGKFVGKLTMEEDGSGKPVLLIGHHLLEGKITSLNKPLAILTRSRTDANPSLNHSSLTHSYELEGPGNDSVTPDAMDCDEDKNDGSGDRAANCSTQWEALGIVKRKIVFAKRPMPVAGRHDSVM